MKSGFTLRISNAKIMDRPRRTIHIGRKIESLWWKNVAFCLVRSEGRGYELLKFGEQLILIVIGNNWPIWTVSCLKKGPNTERSNTRFCVGSERSNTGSVMEHCIHDRLGSRHVRSTRLGSSTLCELFTRLVSFRLPIFWLYESRTCWETHWFVRRCEKMTR